MKGLLSPGVAPGLEKPAPELCTPDTVDIMAVGGSPGNMMEWGDMAARSVSYAALSLLDTSDSALAMLGMLPLMVMTRSWLKWFTSEMELTVIRVSVSCNQQLLEIIFQIEIILKCLKFYF